MEYFLKIVAAVLITVVLGLFLSKQGKDFSGLLSLAGCCLVILGAVTYLDPVIDFVSQLASIGQFDSELINTLLKAVGIGMVAELTSLICNDSGNTSLGKTVHIFSGAVILWLSLPIFSKLLKLIEDILGAL